MDAGALDVLHDAGDQHLLAVADGVDLDFFADQVLVDQDRMIRRQRGLRCGCSGRAGRRRRRPPSRGHRARRTAGRGPGSRSGRRRPRHPAARSPPRRAVAECRDRAGTLRTGRGLRRGRSSPASEPEDRRRRASVSGLARLIAVWPPNWTMTGGMRRRIAAGLVAHDLLRRFRRRAARSRAGRRHRSRSRPFPGWS